MKKIFQVLFALLFIGFSANAQRTVTGTVTEKDGSALPGVAVVVKGTTIGAQTDGNGSFSLSVPTNAATLTLSFLGFASQDVAIPASNVVNVALQSEASTLNEVVISVGSRNTQRTVTDAPIPIDIIGAADLKATGQNSFDKALQYRVPSFNTVQTPVNDATSLLDPYEIRNMGPSRTLILINGKRKNTSSLVYVQTSPGRGETGADISAIPTDAIKRVEILRDGASAQYGSDAIAGVMNIILKDRFDYGTFTINGGVTSKGDGGYYGVSLNNGANLGEKGFVNYTIDLSDRTLANRPGVVDAQGDANDFGAKLSDVQAFLAKYPDAGNINGSPATSAAKFLINTGVDLSPNTQLYANAAYIYKKVSSFANYRTPYWRTTDEGLLHAAGTPYVGYVPTFIGDLNDYNGTIGIRSETNGWKSDVSFTTGGNKQTYVVNNSRNRSLGAASPISFRPGGYEFNHNVGNLDITKALLDNLTLGIGTEFRAESFTVIAGDTASYSGGGADSFPGFNATNAGTFTRYNFGGYLDLGWDVSKDFLINGTVRQEKYSDFGAATVWKISSRYKLADDKFVIRGSVSTGFRAPSLHQINEQLTQASFVPGQGIQIKGLVNNNSPAAFLLGIPKLKAETSTNITLGIGFTPTKNFSITLDYYNIAVKDRIILSSNISPGGTATTAKLDAVLKNAGVVGLSFFTNGINTTTSGLDLVANYRNLIVGSGKLNVNVAGNIQLQNQLDGGLTGGGVINPAILSGTGQSIFDQTQEALLLSSRPKFKLIVGLDYQIGKFGIMLNNTVFGPTTFHQDGIDANLNTEFDTKLVTDLGFNWKVTKDIVWAVNINNILNVIPSWHYVSLNSKGDAVLKDAAALKDITNAITFNGRYSITTYDGSHFSQLGTIFDTRLTFKF